MKAKIKKGHIAPCVFVIAIISIFLYKVPYLTLSDRYDNILYLSSIISDEIKISFRHSVNKGMVIETYIIDKNSNKIFLDKAEFESYGAGMLDEIEDDMVFSTNEKMQIIKYKKKLENNVTYMAAGIAKHIFEYNNDVIDLYEKFGNSSIKIEVKKLNYIEYIFNKWRSI